jgi:hypothetical protein
MSDNADDQGVVEAAALSDRVLTGKRAAGVPFVDHHHGIRACEIVGDQKPPANQRKPHAAK